MGLLACLLVVAASLGHAAGTGTLDRVSGWYRAGSNLTVTATAGTNSVFSGWSGNTNGCSISSNQLSFTVSGPRSVTGVFAASLMHAITVIAPSKGTITPGGTVQVADGGTANFVVAPDKFYSISSVLTNGAPAPVGNPAGFTYVWNNIRTSGTFAAQFARTKTSVQSVPTEWLASAVPASTNDFEVAVTNDADGDGFTNGEEYWVGTDPANSNSYLHVSSIIMTGGVMQIVWSHACVDPGIPPLVIQKCTDLRDGTWGYAAEHAPTNGINTWNAPLSSNAFYRLCVTNMP
jgi:hypothetical protein